MSEVPNVLFPFNGQYFTFEGFVKQIANVLAEAKVYDTSTAKKVDDKLRKRIVQAMAERLKRDFG